MTGLSKAKAIDWTISLLVLACLAWGAFAFGAVYEWAHGPLLAAVLATGAAAAVAGTGTLPAGLCFSAISVAACIAVQLIPLPSDVLARFFQGTHSLLLATSPSYVGSLTLEGIASHPLSIAPDRTRVGLVFFLSSAALTLGLSRYLTRAALRRLAAGIAVIGGLLALEAIAQRALSPGRIYGFWQSEQGGEPFGPFVNKNHFAGWMLMAIPIVGGHAIGLLTRGRPAKGWPAILSRLSGSDGGKAAVLAFTVMGMFVALFLSLSRSGVSAGAGALIFAAAYGSRQRRDAHWILGPAVIIGAALAWVGPEVLRARFDSLSDGDLGMRAAIWYTTAELAGAVPLTGVGIRAFTVATLSRETGREEFHIGAAHSDWLQIVAEGGLLVTVPFVLLLVFLWRACRHRIAEHRHHEDYGTTYWIRVGAMTGLAGIALQSLVEFSLQIPGNLVLCSVLCAVAIAPAPPPLPLRRAAGGG